MNTTAATAQQDALFGDPAPAVPAQRTGPQGSGTQDLDLVASVVKAAQDPGYLIVERSGRIFRADPAKPGVVEGVPAYEAEAVHQLIDSKHLTVGGTHHVHHDGNEGPARSVLVPKATRDMVTRWSNLRPLRDARPPARRTPRPVSGTVRVDVVERGKALVLIEGAGCGGTISRNRDNGDRFGRGGYIVENDHGQVLGSVASFRAGAEKLARHYGYRPGPIEIEHEHRDHRSH